MNIDERISQYLNSESLPVIPYKTNEIVPVRITRLVDYGAFAVTKDRHLASGLIHHSQIPEGLVLRTHQIVDAQVKQIKEDNKLELSLLYLDEHRSPIEPLEEMKAHLPQQEVSNHELAAIIDYLGKEFGLISEEAKNKLTELVREMGVFRFTMAMAKALPQFRRDLVYHFLKEVEQVRDHL